jgi:catechol 2,3-dioxygenase-like lactoylglutathione lyase family enzyme
VQVRVARPTDKLDEVVMFYRNALGLPVIGQFQGHAGYSGVMLEIPGTQMHLEFTHADHGSPCPAPTRDNLLVLYFVDHLSYLKALNRMQLNGHSPLDPENPYWLDRSHTFEDPDGWRVVLYDGAPFGLPK